MNITLKTWYEKGYLNYSLIPFVALGLVIAHQIYLNLPQKDDRPPFTIGGVSQGSVGNLCLVFSVEDKNGKVGDEFVLKFALTNHGEADYVRRMGLPLFDMNVYDLNGVWLGNWSAGRRLTPNKSFLSYRQTKSSRRPRSGI